MLPVICGNRFCDDSSSSYRKKNGNGLPQKKKLIVYLINYAYIESIFTGNGWSDILLSYRYDLDFLRNWHGNIHSVLVPVISKLIAFERIAREDKILVTDIPASEIRNLHCRPEESHFDTQADGIERFSVNQPLHLTDTHELGIFQFQSQQIGTLVGCPAVLEIIQIVVELSQVFVFLVRIGLIYLNFLLFLIHHIGSDAVVPRSVAFLAVPHLLAFIADAASCLVDANDIHIVRQRRALRTVHHLIGPIEYISCLPGVDGIWCTGIHTGYDEKGQYPYHPPRCVFIFHNDTHIRRLN
jgi:hypothetical protein